MGNIAVNKVMASSGGIVYFVLSFIMRLLSKMKLGKTYRNLDTLLHKTIQQILYKMQYMDRLMTIAVLSDVVGSPDRMMKL